MLMLSTPQASTVSSTPDFTRLYAKFTACCDEPHWESTVLHAVSSGSPAVSQAVRVTFMAWAPIWSTQPPTTWPMGGGVDAPTARRRPTAPG